MHRTETDDDGTKILAGTSIPSSGPPLGPTVIPFPSRDRAAASSDLAAGGDPPSPPASFISLGSATAAVVMRLSTQFPRFKMLTQTTGEEET